MDYRVPPVLDGPLLTLFGTSFPLYRAFMMLVTLLVLASLWLLLRWRVGLVIRAALSHPGMAEALGHNVPRVFTLVFGGGCALAALAGVLGGNAFVTEPGMAMSVGGLVFVVVVVGGLGSLAGALWASLLIGLLQTFAVALDVPAAPVLPYLLMVLKLHPVTAARASSLRVTRAAVWGGYALVLGLAPLLFTSSLSQSILSQIGIAVIVCLSYNLLLGQGGMLSFGHAVYAGTGAFLAIHTLNRVSLGWLLPVSLIPLAGGLASALQPGKRVRRLP
jgi:ABC-type branched-subunit amino acid transport system permease subunit